jgi:hypothetical protein
MMLRLLIKKMVEKKEIEDKNEETKGIAFEIPAKERVFLEILKRIYRQTSRNEMIYYLIKKEIPVMKEFVKEQEKTDINLRVLNAELIKEFNEATKKNI